MYVKSIISLCEKKYRDEVISISKQLADQHCKNRVTIALDMIMCGLIYGASYREYYNMDFLNRTAKNRATYITTYYNFKLYDKFNEKKYRYIFRDKIKFNTIYKNYIGRKWVDVKSEDKVLIRLEELIKNGDRIVLKNSRGDSGEEVKIFHLGDNKSPVELRNFMINNNYDLAEEFVTNHNAISLLNSSSLNTIRVVTITTNNNVKFLFAGLRVGQQGAELDNISQGGTVAKLDIKTGRIASSFHTLNDKHLSDMKPYFNKIGYQIPFWNELIRMLIDAANITPQIGIVAWDVAITQNGPIIIEGNESFGSNIMQIFYKYNEEGLKPLLQKLLRDS